MLQIGKKFYYVPRTMFRDLVLLLLGFALVSVMLIFPLSFHLPVEPPLLNRLIAPIGLAIIWLLCVLFNIHKAEAVDGQRKEPLIKIYFRLQD